MIVRYLAAFKIVKENEAVEVLRQPRDRPRTRHLLSSRGAHLSRRGPLRASAASRVEIERVLRDLSNNYLATNTVTNEAPYRRRDVRVVLQHAAPPALSVLGKAQGGREGSGAPSTSAPSTPPCLSPTSRCSLPCLVAWTSYQSPTSVRSPRRYIKAPRRHRGALAQAHARLLGREIPCPDSISPAIALVIHGYLRATPRECRPNHGTPEHLDGLGCRPLGHHQGPHSWAVRLARCC